MSAWGRMAEGVLRRVRGPYLALGNLDARLQDVQDRLVGLERALESLGDLRTGVAQTDEKLGSAIEIATETNELLKGEVRAILRALVSEESSNRRSLHSLRAGPEYEAAWSDPKPLVSVTIATRDRAELLATRSLPSILGQTYSELELIVIGDHADDETAQAVRSLGDPRVIYRNLPQHLRFAEDSRRHWLAAATMPRNEGMRLARGRWVIPFDDDDAMRPDCVERLLALAREQHLEAVYGQIMCWREGQTGFAIGSFPPELGKFSWAAGMYHGGLRFFERELIAADLGIPGDWFLAERMLRAGVRFGMLGAILCDVFPSPMNQVEPTADD